MGLATLLKEDSQTEYQRIIRLCILLAYLRVRRIITYRNRVQVAASERKLAGWMGACVFTPPAYELFRKSTQPLVITREGVYELLMGQVSLYITWRYCTASHRFPGCV